MEPSAAAAAADVHVLVSHKGEQHRIPLPVATTTVGQLKALLAERTGVQPEHQKLIYKSKTLADPEATLGILLGGGEAALKLVLIGATASEIEQLEAAAQAAAKGRGRVVDDLRLLTAGAGGARRPASGGLRRRQYGFQSIEVLPGLPDSDRARTILEELAEDPGVLHVMATFKWSVGALCELYPEGYVGVSDVCVMGLNQNKGQKILLRLRTDDLKGWRKILSIKKVLYHELAHNEHADHDDNFYILMRKIENEVVAFNSSGRSLGGGAGGMLMPQPEAGRGAFVGGSGRLGGESAALTGLLSAREMAGLAAAQRKTEEEQAIEDACPSGKAEGQQRLAHARPHDAASPVVALGTQAREVVAPASASAASAAEEDGVGMDVEEENGEHVGGCCGGHPHHHDASAAGKDEGSGRDESKAEASLSSLSLATGAGAAAAPSSAPEPKGAEIRGAGVAEGKPSSSTSPAPISTPAPLPVDEGAVEQLLALGFGRESVVAALRRAGGDVERAANLLVASGGVVEEEQTPLVMHQQQGEEDEVVLDPSTREGRAVAAARKLVWEETRGDAAGRAAALSTLRGMIQAVLDHPGEAKYRRVRLGNAKFQRAVGRYPSAFELLRAIGFEKRTTPEGEAVLELTRDDAGLLWLGRSALEAEEQRASEA